MNTQRRWFWLAFLGLAAGLALIPELFFTPDPEYVPATAGVTSKAPDASAAQTQVPAEATPATPRNLPQADLFSAHSWYRPPVAVPVVQAPPPQPQVVRPMAPPLPFQFIGRMDDSQRLQVFLLSGDRLHVVTTGDVIDNLYRVERIDAGQMILIYLPMKVSQSLSMESRL